MHTDLEQQLQQLAKLDRQGLQQLWVELFDKPPHQKLRREVLVPVLAYRLQEKSLGGLKPSTCKRLRRLAEGFTNKKTTANNFARLKPGTRIMREWQGQLHEISVLDTGFEYSGQHYHSLSEIARQITGTRWSGPLFFGLKKRSTRTER